ncbi:hypothetical protein SPBR_05271 [Sporothrix brasiliensis 5110]|uniref:Uncharacterized protein n=1 Tax=Sporothrix brasiliensis 5110 TaxID=1398154 RepID=A0A0C2F8U7_9PEZI|nr:uncharacterized protein SPBR_05271 [Sporothrix brasiliensis 5110]KIH87493.1 hypothetical protein SPBR_05271 [Sporothrix brasiliensis 5110]
MNTNGVFSRIHNFDLDVPPDIDPSNIAPMLSKFGPAAVLSTSPASPSSPKAVSFPWSLSLNNMNLASLASADHFALLHSTASQLYADHAGTMQSLGASIRPHLRGPMMPVLIIAVSILVSVLVSFIVSILQMAVLAAAVVYFFPSVITAVTTATSVAGPTSGKSPGNPVSRTPVAAFAGVLAAAYAFSSTATLVVLASSVYAYLNHAALAARDNANKINSSRSTPERRSTRRDEQAPSHSNIFRRISGHRDSY